MSFEKSIINHIHQKGMLIVSIKLIDSLMLINVSNLYRFQKLANPFFLLKAEAETSYLQLLLTLIFHSDQTRGLTKL